MSSKLGAVLVILLGVCVGACYVSGVARRRSIELDTARILDECDQWEARIEELQLEVDAAGTDQYVEKIARERLGLVKPGETLYIVADPDGGEFTPVKRRSDRPVEIRD